MKPLFTILLACFAANLFAQDDPESKPPMLAYVGGGLSVANGAFNDYKVGNANEFYQYLTGDPSLKLDDGAIGFKYFSFGIVGASAKNNKMTFGAEFGLILGHSSHAISGTNHGMSSAGANMSFGMKMIDIGFRFGPALDSKGSNIALELGSGMAFMNGSISIYGTGGQSWAQKGATGNPIRGGISMDFVAGKSILINARMGYRVLKINEMHKDSNGKSVTFYANGNDGDLLQVDWSGAYASVGLGLILNSKKKP